MTGLGIVGLAGIVVKNGILVIEFSDEFSARGLKTREAVIQAGKTRIIPVMLTALAAILALIPLQLVSISISLHCFQNLIQISSLVAITLRSGNHYHGQSFLVWRLRSL